VVCLFFYGALDDLPDSGERGNKAGDDVFREKKNGAAGARARIIVLSFRNKKWT
jgi:hypothetical protein